MAKIRNFDSLRAIFPHFCRDKREIWHGGADLRAKFHVRRGNVSPLRGEKPIFGPLSKNNTSMAALCAGLPVMEKHHTFSSTAGARTTIPTILGMVIEEVRTIFASP